MLEGLQFSPNNFTRDVVVLRFIKNRSIKGLRNILIFLERYKFVSPSVLVNSLNDLAMKQLSMQPEDRVVDWSTKPIMEGVPVDIIGIEGYSVIPLLIEKDKLYLGFDCTKSLEDKRDILVEFRNYDIKFVPLLPHQYEEFSMDEKDLHSQYEGEHLYNKILMEATKRRATDVLIGSYYINMKEEFFVRFRVSGIMEDFKMFNLSETLNIKIGESITKKLPKATEDSERPAGIVGVISDPFQDGNIEVRVAMTKQNKAFYIASRLQTQETVNFRVKDLGFDEKTEHDLNILERKESGVTLITGSTNTGKNTTLLALANTIVERPIQIIEISSPIESKRPWAPFDYQNSQENLLAYSELAKKLNPDIILINEIPGPRVASGMLDLVNTGHGVITTMHINRIWHLPQKLYQFYGEGYLALIEQLNGVVNQKRFSKCCPFCRTTIKVNFDNYNSEVKDFCLRFDIKSQTRNTGCEKCRQTGKSSGIKPYAESLIFTAELRQRLLSCSTFTEMSQEIEKEVKRNEASLEYKIANAIKAGDLTVDDIYTIL